MTNGEAADLIGEESTLSIQLLEHSLVNSSPLAVHHCLLVISFLHWCNTSIGGRTDQGTVIKELTRKPWMKRTDQVTLEVRSD